MQHRIRPHHKERTAWHNMKQRCYNPSHNSYKNYGGRGIKVSKEWLASFENFYANMGDRPEGLTLDRIDPNKDYSAENCRWASYKVQIHTRRMFAKNSTGYRGVSYYKNRTSKNKYTALVLHNGVLTSLGWYATAEEAAIAYDCGAIQAYGDLAQLNVL